MTLSFRFKVFCIVLLLIQQFTIPSFGIIPHPTKVVVLVLENHGYSQIVGSHAAPYINNLINDSLTALFTQSYGLAHPSQPNYLHLFAGSNLGVTNNNVPPNTPFTAPNLGGYLINASRTFIGYSEDLPSVGYLGASSGNYTRKHSPWVHWQGASVNGIPDSLNQPFSAFPADYNLLPDVSFVIPGNDNNMHDGSDPGRISTCDTWIQNNLDGYIQWAKVNNSVFILTYDEDDNLSSQRILTLFSGEMVRAGSYSNHIDHYNILRTIEDFFNLPYAGASATAATIDYCWKDCEASITTSGPVYFCQGDSVKLIASTGVSQVWSTGDSSTSIIVSSTGSYFVTVTDATGCTSTSPVMEVVESNFSSFGLLFNETVGTVLTTTSISDHEVSNGFDNDNFTMMGTGDVRPTIPSGNYPGASGGANVFITNSAGKNYIIADINTSGLTDLQLSFGIFKNRTLATGSDLIVQVSSDGINYTTLSYSNLPTGTGTAIWHHRIASGVIPATSNLRIQFIQTNVITQYRIDDVTLKYATGGSTTISISATGPTTFCAGDSVKLSSSPSVSYTWSDGQTTNEIYAGISGNYYVLGTLLSGCVISSNVINVKAFPIINPSVSINSNIGSSICAGDNLIFTAFPTYGGTSPVYQWKENGNVVGANSNTHSNNAFLDNDVITCTITSNAQCTSTPTAISNNIIIDLNFNVTPEVFVDNDWDDTLCTGDVITFTATTIFSGSSPDFQWQRNGSNVGSNSSTYTTTSLSNGDVVTCTMTSSANCVSPAVVVSNSNSVVVYPTASPQVSISSNVSSAICSGTNVTFTATPVTGGPAPIYQWKKNGVNTGTNSNNYSNNSLADGDSITCVMTSTAPCSNPADAVSNIIIISITPPVIPAVTITANTGTTICSGATVIFSAAPVNGGTTPVYQWKKNGNSVGTNSINYTTVSLINGDVITCVITSTATCASPASVTSNGITMNVVSNVTTSASISATPGNNICFGTNVTFTVTPVNGGTSPTILWKRNGLNIGSNSNTFSSSNLFNGDNISCFVTSNATCASPSGVSSNSIVMIVIPAAIPSVSISSNTGNVYCLGANVVFTATPANGGSNPSYQWLKNGTTVGINNNTYSDNTLANNDNISCRLTSNANCVSGNPATSNTLNIAISPVPTITSFSPTAASTGIGITINGTNLSGVTSVSFNGINASFIINNNSQLTAFVPAGATSGTISVSNTCGDATSGTPITLNASSLEINLVLFIEGYYSGGGQMKGVVNASVCDTITVELHQSISPYATVYISRNVINTSGFGTFNFPLAVDGNSYYIVVFNHNSLKTWSANPVLFNSSMTYDFSQSASQAFGNNLKDLGDGNFALYSGDITHDGIINIADYSEIRNSSQLFLTGYLKEDLTGDRIIESADFSIIENNLFIIFTIHP